MSVERITQSRKYNRMDLTGDDPDKSTGLIVELPKYQTVYIEHLIVSNVFVALTLLGEGSLRIGTLEATNCGGDLIDLWTGKFSLGRFIFGDNPPTRPYEEYHSDLVQIERLRDFQSQKHTALEDVFIRSIHGTVEENRQGIILSGKHPYRNLHLGTSEFTMKFAEGHSSPVSFNAYSVSESSIGASTGIIDTNGHHIIDPRGETQYKSESNYIHIP